MFVVQEQNQVSPNMRPKTLPSPLSSAGRTSLDFSKLESPTAALNFITGNTHPK